jgi:hypothetical protein
MTPDIPAVSRSLAEILQKLSPARQEEVNYRIDQGDIPFLPEDVTIERGRLHFPGMGWMPAPDVDPATLPLDDIELFFIIARGDGYVLEVALKTEAVISDSFKRIQKDAAFRTQTALSKYLRRAKPDIARELLSRLKRGQLAFLPENVAFERDKIYLGPNAGWLPLPEGFDPRANPMHSIAMLFVIASAGGEMLEIVWRPQ